MLTRPDASLTPTGSATLSNSNSNSGATALAASQSSLVSKQEQERMQQQVNRAHDLNEELNILRGRYFRLTGIDYDTQQSRRVVRRRGSKSGGPDEAGSSSWSLTYDPSSEELAYYQAVQLTHCTQ